MTIYYSFPPGWWLVTVLFYGLWAALFVTRKSYGKKKEVKLQIIFGLFALLLAVVVESVGVGSGLWTYFPGNWPVILWVNYFGSGLMGYQVLKRIEELS